MFRFFALIITCIFIVASLATAQTITSSSYTIRNAILSNGLTKGSSVNFGLGQSLGQRVVGKASSSNFQLWSGYQYFTIPTRFTLLGTSATTQAGAIVLQWTTPIIPSGDPITGYDVGIGTTPYAYTFQSVGNATSFTKTGLTNGTRYYVIIKAKTTGSLPIAYSNQVSVVPSGTNPGPGGGGGGGGGGDDDEGGNVIIKGLAYPNTKVVILKDGSIAATTIADPGAAFSVEIGNLNPGDYTFGVYTEDAEKLKSTTSSFPVSVDESITVTIDNVFLAPSIGVSSRVVKKGDPIGIFGTTVPNATVTLHVHSTPEFVERVAASAVGRWFKQFDTSLLALGDHVTFSRSSFNDRVTDQSQTVAFVVGEATIPNDLTKRSDLNNDGRVNITDFSMLLYYWQATPPPTSKADITKDAIVNILDLSIMLYDWTG